VLAGSENVVAAGGKDVFVHISAVERAGLGTLNEGQRVNYELATDRGKESAANAGEIMRRSSQALSKRARDPRAGQLHSN
jgi:cold shock CspA family protein